MFTLYKLIKPFFLPPTLIAIGMLTSFLLFVRKKDGLGKICLLLTLLVYCLLSSGPVAYLLARGLEWGSDRKLDGERGAIEAVVVLSGGVSKEGGCRPFSELSGSSWRRLWHGIEVYKRLRGRVPILYSGGSGNPFNPVSGEDRLARDYALAMNIPKEKFWIEPSSRNTFESGIEIKRILDNRYPESDKHRIVLVTSALHLPRSTEVMKKIGLYVIPSPADFPIGSLNLNPLSFFPKVGNLSISSFCIHEWMGIWTYRLLGRI